MSFFLPSFLQKRVLRYALSRLELLDTDALNLENLDITWGKRSTVELRGVSIRIEKLAALLRLPQAFSITHATILTLRLTIPSDLYQSGIIIEACGIDVKVNADLGSAENQEKPYFKHTRERYGGPSKRHKADRPRSTQSHIHDPGGLKAPNTDSDDYDGHGAFTHDLPTTADLAQSFLETKSREERAEMQGEMLQSQYLDQSQTSEGSVDQESAVGIGRELSLPVFLAAFLKGVVDRIQVRIRSVQVEFVLVLHLPLENSMGNEILENSENVMFRLSIGDMVVDGMQQHAALEAHVDNQKPFASPAHNFRRVSISNIYFMMVCESSLFSHIARSPIPSSPGTTHANSLITPKSNSYISPTPERPHVERSTTSPKETSDRPFSSNSDLPNFLCTDEVPAGRERVNDFSRESTSRNASITDGATDESSLSASTFFSAKGERQDSDNAQSPLEDMDPSLYIDSDNTSPLGLSISQGLIEDVNEGRPRNTSPPAMFHAYLAPDIKVAAAHTKIDGLESAHIDSNISNNSGSSAEEMTKSKLFSHEEASSVYMSAVSQKNSDRDVNYEAVPGHWEDSSSDDPLDGRKRPKVQDDHRSLRKPFHSPRSRATSDDEALNTGDLALKDDWRSSTLKSPISISRPSVQGETGNHTEPTVAQRNTKESSASSQASESSANGKHPQMLGKKIVSIDSIAFEINAWTNRPEADASMDEDSRSYPIGLKVPTRSEDSISERQESEHSISIEISSIQIFVDMTLVKMSLLTVQQLIKALGELNPRQTRGFSSNLDNQTFTMKMKVGTLSCTFLDLVGGQALRLNSSSELKHDIPSTAGDSEVLLKAEISQLQITREHTKASPTLEISVGKFRFGYASTDILSFDSGLRMRDSTRDVLAPSNADLLLTVQSHHDTRSIELRTLPLHINLDLRKLDETFGWFGGLSSILDLGNSMKSTMMFVDSKARDHRSTRPTRSVHFEDPKLYSTSQRERGSTKNKATARIGGIMVELQGNHSSLRFEGTAMKLVNRTEGIGLVIDRLRLGGPYLVATRGEPSLMVTLLNVRLEYLSTPKEVDLERLLALVRPSQDENEIKADDGLLINTMLRQRRQGGVVRFTVERLKASISNLDDLHHLPLVAEDLKQLSTVAKYLPEDDRPGILTLSLVRNVEIRIHIDENFGVVDWTSENVEAAYVTFPSLLGLGIQDVDLVRNGTEELVTKSLLRDSEIRKPLAPIWIRFIGNEMEPTVEVKLYGLRIEYHINTLLAIMGLEESTSPEELLHGMMSSVATLTSGTPNVVSLAKVVSQSSVSSEKSVANLKVPNIDLRMKDVIIGLNPRDSTAKGLLILEDMHMLSISSSANIHTALEAKRISMMVINDQSVSIGPTKLNTSGNSIELFTSVGYVTVSTLLAAKLVLQISNPRIHSSRSVDVHLDGGLLLLETCADSAQTLQHVLNGLSLPKPKSTELKYRTEVVPIEDLVASFSANAYATSEEIASGTEEEFLGLDEGDMVSDEVPRNLEFVSSFYNPVSRETSSLMTDSLLEEDFDSIATPSIIGETGDRNLRESVEDQAQAALGNAPLDFREDHFGSKLTDKSTAHVLCTGQDAYGQAKPVQLSERLPLKACVRDFHVIWNLFDGYDWQKTRDAIGQAVADVQSKAAQRSSYKDKRRSMDLQDQDEDVIGDFLFNSIYIGIPANRDPTQLARQVNRNIDDLSSETSSHATSTSSSSPNRQGQTPRQRDKKLRLERSKHHKMTIELKGVAADFIVFPTGTGETQSSIDLRIKDLEIFDHVPTSTWKKFATYMLEAGEKESGTSMVHIEVLNVKPVPDLSASEIILKATILPLRLHVDQDALDFISRFFEFRDESISSPTTKADSPFLQRVEVNAVRVKLDFKPKRVDYGGLRSGHTTEFMNFFILDGADMVLRRVIIYGVSGFDKLGKTLNDIWMPDVKRTQLPGVLAGLGPIRSLVNMGGGVRDLVVIPIREYQKDGRVVRSFQKGAFAFAKTTTSELVKLGTKLAIGTQTVLQTAEDLLTQQQPQEGTDVTGGWEDAELNEEEKKQISLYAHQPIGVIQGLRGGYASLERDLLMAKDAIVAMPGEAMERGTAGGAARAVLRSAPTIILRPAMGVSKAVGQTLMGATNSLDSENRRRIADKYKSH